MKYWDKLATTTALLFGLAAPAFAQTPATPAPVAPTTQAAPRVPTAPAVTDKAAPTTTTHAKAVKATKLRKHHKAAAKKLTVAKAQPASTPAK